MRVALLAPISHSVPPSGYGPWERVVADLAEALVGRGHAVTVFAAAGSAVGAEVVATTPGPLDAWPFDGPPDPRVWEEIHIADAMRRIRAGRFDIVHNHLHVHALGYADMLPCPTITTLHGVAWNRAVHPALDRYRHLPFVSLSEAERRFYPGLDYVATIHNGIAADAFPLGSGDGDYLLFAGRMAPEKAPHLAIQSALGAGRRLVLAGPVEERHRAYFQVQVEPWLDGDRVRHLGAVDSQRMSALYGGAEALLMPLEWDEPFGLVAVEALMSGTPVVGWRRGALPELIEDGLTGFLVESTEEAAEAVGRIAGIDRRLCRKAAESRFERGVMAAGYADAYRRVISDWGERGEDLVHLHEGDPDRSI